MTEIVPQKPLSSFLSLSLFLSFSFFLLFSFFLPSFLFVLSRTDILEQKQPQAIYSAWNTVCSKCWNSTMEDWDIWSFVGSHKKRQHLQWSHRQMCRIKYFIEKLRCTQPLWNKEITTLCKQTTILVQCRLSTGAVKKLFTYVWTVSGPSLGS